MVLFMLCLNIASGLYYSLGIAGSQYSNPIQNSGNPSDYSDRFDPDKIMPSQPSVLSYFPYLGIVYQGLMPLYNAIMFVFFGFPQFLLQFGGLIQDPLARSGYITIIGAIGAIEFMVMASWIYQLVTGRQVQD